MLPAAPLLAFSACRPAAAHRRSTCCRKPHLPRTGLGSRDNIAAFTAKLNIGDRSRVAAAIAHYEPHIDFDVLLNDVVS